MIGARIERERAEALKRLITALGLLDKGHRIVDDGAEVTFPLGAVPAGRESIEIEELGGSIVDAEFEARDRQPIPFQRIVGELDLPGELAALLPRKWEMLGEVLLLQVDPALRPRVAEVARAYADVLGASTVALAGGIAGEMREQSVEVVLGERTETVHLENGIRYRMDVARVMFSSGNIDERVRISRLNMGGETVVDMFAGIGYFTLPVAVHCRPARVVSYEINPVAHDYLLQNIELNCVSDIVEPVLGDNRNAEEGIADRVVMGYIKTTHEFLEKAFRILRPGGGVIHYHETCPNELLFDRQIRRVAEAAERAGRTVHILRQHKIKSYAPGVSHVVLDVRVG